MLYTQTAFLGLYTQCVHNMEGFCTECVPIMPGKGITAQHIRPWVLLCPQHICTFPKSPFYDSPHFSRFGITVFEFHTFFSRPVQYHANTLYVYCSINFKKELSQWDKRKWIQAKNIQVKTTRKKKTPCPRTKTQLLQWFPN